MSIHPIINKQNNIFFISGTGTDVGKTIVTGMMARYLIRHNFDVITIKLVQTGNTGESEDIIRHREIMGGFHFQEDSDGFTAPQIFRFPASPHLAAALEGRKVDLNAIEQAIEQIAQKHQLVLVEGAGGLAVPLTEDLLTIDFVARQNWPLILVTSGYLGSLNHTLLSLEAIAARKMNLMGTVCNYSPGENRTIRDDSLRMIKKYLHYYKQSESIVCVPELDFSNLPEIDFSSIFDLSSCGQNVNHP